MVSKIILFAFIVSTASAAVWMAVLPEKPSELAHKEGCYVKEVKDVIPFDSTVTPLGVCLRIHCTTVMINYASCGVVYTDDPKCHKTGEDVSRPYPECCPSIKCDLDNNLL